MGVNHLDRVADANANNNFFKFFLKKDLEQDGEPNSNTLGKKTHTYLNTEE